MRKNIEIIVINDGTKDKSIEIISETTLLSFVHQIGVQGAIALICIFYFMSKEVLEKVQKNSQFKNRFLFYVPMILIFVSIYQANTYSKVDRKKALREQQDFLNHLQERLSARSQGKVEVYITDEKGNRITMPKYEPKFAIENDYEVK